MNVNQKREKIVTECNKFTRRINNTVDERFFFLVNLLREFFTITMKNGTITVIFVCATKLEFWQNEMQIKRTNPQHL